MSVTPAKTTQFSPVYFVPDYFSLSVSPQMSKTHIIMRLFTKSVNTNTNPNTHLLLRKNLPSILSSVCFNNQNLPFAKEVRKTEFGHLFEHILLEYLCRYKLLNGAEEAVYNGNTRWNWQKEEWGTFHIVIDSGKIDEDIFPLALEESIRLIKKIMGKELKYLN